MVMARCASKLWYRQVPVREPLSRWTESCVSQDFPWLCQLGRTILRLLAFKIESNTSLGRFRGPKDWLRNHEIYREL